MWSDGKESLIELVLKIMRVGKLGTASIGRFFNESFFKSIREMKLKLENVVLVLLFVRC